MSLISTLSEIDSTWMYSRYQALQHKRYALINQGYDVQQISANDVECFWLTVHYRERIFKIEHIEEIQTYIKAIDDATIG
jgi:hypothetical protein